MTKVTVIGESQKKCGKEIELTYEFRANETNADAVFNANDFVELIAEEYTTLDTCDNNHVFDLIFCYDGTNRDDGQLYLGKWNDGIVK